jgi:Zn-dependent protease with chaperone function
MRSFLSLAILLFTVSLPAEALDDGHSLESVREALRSPIPQSAVEQARRADDQILQTGFATGVKISMVTDQRLQHTQALVQRVLVSIGDNPQGWVVRVLDTDPKVVNAFVNGGKYVYVFTGLLEQVRSDDEFAVVVGHEIGHSVLKHNIRRNSDLTSTLANLASLVVQIKGGSCGGAMALGKALHNGYSRDDEREADAFGVLAAWRAHFDPLQGAAFFTRLEQSDEAAAAKETKTLDDYKSQLLAAKSQCETWRQQWAAGQLAKTQQNADLINQQCAQYEQGRESYIRRVAQDTADAAQARTGDHPINQERIAAIAAETDWLHGVRPLASMQAYPRAYTVIAALIQDNSPIFAGLLHKSAAPATSQASDGQRLADDATAAQKVADDESARAIEAERERLARVRQLDAQSQKRKLTREEIEKMTPEQLREASQ